MLKAYVKSILIAENDKIKMVITSARHIAELEKFYKYPIEEIDQNVEIPNQPLIFGVGTEMENIKDIVASIRDTDATVLISGESGVGKGVLARYIHDSSERAEGNLIAINCGAIPKDLIESELFGYESGAFTGASLKVKEGFSNWQMEEP